MANHCASLDPSWGHLPAPPPSPWPYAAWLSPATAYENEALTSALRASMSGAAASSSPTPSSSTTTTTSSASELAAPPPRPARAQAREGATGRISKRRPRPSRRAQTTYISADPANFMRMVQEITGLPVPGADPASAFSLPPPPPRPAAPACVLPTLDTSAFLLDRAPAPPSQEPKEHDTSTRAAATMAAATEADAEESSLLLELEAMVGAAAASFPTLESCWGMF